MLFIFEFVFIMFKHFLITDSFAYKIFLNVVASCTENYSVAFCGRFVCTVYQQQETDDENEIKETLDFYLQLHCNNFVLHSVLRSLFT
jgi:hypothetical protein